MNEIWVIEYRFKPESGIKEDRWKPNSQTFTKYEGTMRRSLINLTVKYPACEYRAVKYVRSEAK